LIGTNRESVSWVAVIRSFFIIIIIIDVRFTQEGNWEKGKSRSQVDALGVGLGVRRQEHNSRDRSCVQHTEQLKFWTLDFVEHQIRLD
jgi:hypothetical protein